MKDYHFYLKLTKWIAKTSFQGDIAKAVNTLETNYRTTGEAKCDVYMKIEKATNTNSPSHHAKA